MPRRLKVKTKEMGDMELYLIYQEGKDWESEWRPLQGAEITSLLTVISKETLDHVLAGWSKPFTTALGIPPDGALRKLPQSRCYQRLPCPFYQPKICLPTAKEMPWCFEPDGIDDTVSRKLASTLVSLWREGVYIVVVQEGVPSV